ncbi:MAG: DUF3021 domain-containing protein [Oscillospiraceae bacterium]|nr:DUF3021 domain-containing protein [Oscillospiraceae bacterium]
MKKKILKHSLFGILLGLALWAGFILWAFWLRGDGQLRFVSGQLMVLYGSERNAVTAECAGAVLIGLLWSNAALIWRETDWSLLKQTAVHYLVCVVPSLLIACAMGFMPRSLDGLGQYLLLFGVLYGLNWIIQYSALKARVRKMNQRLRLLEERE